MRKWNNYDYRNNRATPISERESQEVAKSMSRDVEQFLRNGGKIELVPLDKTHKNVLTVKNRLERVKRLDSEPLVAEDIPHISAYVV